MTAPSGSLDVWEQRVEAADWNTIHAELDEIGGALIGPLLSAGEAAELAAVYSDDSRFRSTIDMARYRFGEGEYRYFTPPLPEPLDALKRALYLRLRPIARQWWAKLNREAPWPESLGDWLAMCHAAGQTRSTATLLKYGPGDWNALHRDLYGDLVFPLQVVIHLTVPGVDHTGGEFVLYEQRPRAQSRATAIVIPHGHGLVFTTRDRPIASTRGWTAAAIRHGVSVIRSGHRLCVGLVFHDAA